MNLDCDACKKQAHCKETSYVWLKAERAHGIDRSNCKPQLTWSARWARIKAILWSYYWTLKGRLAT
jgi:hypothetical protein